MSTLSTLNSIQKQFTDLAPSNVTDKEKSARGETFAKTFDSAMKQKEAVVAIPVNLALQVGQNILGQSDMIPKAGPASMKDKIEGIFAELSVGIAGSFVAALAGEDSATALTPSVDRIKDKTVKNDIAAHPECLAHEVTDEVPLITATNIPDTKKVIDNVAPLLPSNKALPITNSRFSAFNDLLFDNEDKKDQQKG